jgi:hypothetical protein
MTAALYFQLPHGFSYRAISSLNDMSVQEDGTWQGNAEISQYAPEQPFYRTIDGQQFFLASALVELLAQVSAGTDALPAGDSSTGCAVKKDTKVAILKVQSFSARCPYIPKDVSITVRAHGTAPTNGICSVRGYLLADGREVARAEVMTFRSTISKEEA